MTVERWLAFVGVLLVVLCTPGPDFLVVLRHSLRGGIRAGMYTAAGIVTGLTVHTITAAAGLSMLVAAHPPVLRGIQLAGAAYLAWLGVTALRASLPRRGGAAAAEIAVDGPPAGTHPYRDGFASNVLNPKAVLFFVGLLPQFVTTGATAATVTAQTLLLAVTTVVASALWWALVIQVTGRGRRLMTGPRTRRLIEGVAGTAFLGLAAAMVV
ncbi:threonine/homoserine/homoserine lactone efflux protein [Prauserella shujinwangii]|uniref:Threonine/homoserine/homoserine lactone efflux protein n=1 Tax=Prauserella shujinwangii TaxID=1453103 RepID=A0A2T0LSC3_9PSEU|nr:LysE family translocator [Prauserella shujinwangii]PRX46570.1 threonine/homoserine/homoserine lactone efflux protein [Prauserella shujinwangii]